MDHIFTVHIVLHDLSYLDVSIFYQESALYLFLRIYVRYMNETRQT